MRTAPIRFKNISQFDQLGVAPNQEGEAEITEEEARRMQTRGAIEILDGDHDAAEPQEPALPDPTPPGVPDPPELIEQEKAADGDEPDAEETTTDEPEADKRGRGGRGR